MADSRGRRVELRNRRISASEVLGLDIHVGVDEPKFLDWLNSALNSADGRDRDEAGAAIRGELEAI